MEKLHISKNGRYFTYPDGTPFTWLADTTWTMPQRMKWDDVTYFMEERKRQGFTVLQIVALDPERDIEMRNPTGEKALLDDDLLTPNERYFSYLDWILDKAEEYGFYVLLLPVWGQLVVGHDWGGNTYEKTVTEANAYQYGKWIGERYKNKNHILWCLGGDRQPIHLGVDYRPVWRKMAEGLAKGLTGRDLHYNKKDPAWEKLMITYHACYEMETGECSTMSYWTEEEAWIRFIMLQSGHGLKPKNYELVKKEYERENVMPVWDGEPAYEMMPTSWPPVNASFHDSWMVRKRAYWSLFAGSFGHTYGHCSVWCSIAEKEKNAMSQLTWFEALKCEGAEQMKHLRALMESLQIMTYRPAQDLLPEENETAKLDLHQQCCIQEESRNVCVYLPSGGKVELNLKKAGYTEQAFVWWYNPRDGKFYTFDGTETDQTKNVCLEDGKLQIEAPESGEEKDWILIVQTEEKGQPIQSKTYFDAEKDGQLKKVFVW